MEKLIKKILFLDLVLFIFIGCGNNKKNPLNEKKFETVNSNKKTIGFSIDTLAIERWQRDLDVFMNKAKELGANVIVQNAGNSVEEQNRQLMYLLDRNVDVIIVVPKEANSLSETIQKINSKNIPIIAYDRLIRNANIDLYITINSETTGRLMAEGLVHLTPGTNWFCILGPEEDYNMTLIKQGIISVIQPSPIKLNHIYHTAGWNYDLAYEEASRLLTDNIIPDAIVCGNDAIANAVIQALDLYYPDKHIPICGQDADISACQHIVKGKQDFTIYKPIINLAEKVAEYAVLIANGEKVQNLPADIRTIDNAYGQIPTIMLEPVRINKSNMEDIIIRSGFHSENEIFKD